MSSHNAGASATVHRIDKFVVPATVLPAFVGQMQRIQRILRTLPGCLGQKVLTQTGGSGEFNVLTVVEWEDADAVSAAQAFVQQKFAEEGFDPAAFVKANGIRADLGFYSVAREATDGLRATAPSDNSVAHDRPDYGQ